MVEPAHNFSGRVKANDFITRYLDEKGVDYVHGGVDLSRPDLPVFPYNVPPEPSDHPCYVLECIPQKFWERVVRIGLEEIVKRHNCKLAYCWREFVDHHNDDMKIVLYVVNK